MKGGRSRHVTYVGEKRNVYRIFITKLEGKRPHRKVGVDGRIILKWCLKE